MKHLWAPWRMNYILERKEEGCLFCKKPLEKRDRVNLILYRGRHSFVMMNKFPYNNGHLMVVPNRHCLELGELRKNEMNELFHLLKAAIRVLNDVLHPHGFNIGVNLGKAGGAGQDHLHVHIVPRWAGDTNFMPLLGEVKIIPQYLDKTYRSLRLRFENLLKNRRSRKG